MEGKGERRGRDAEDRREGKAEGEGNERGEGRVVVCVEGSVESRQNGGNGEGKNLAVDPSPEEGKSGGQRVQSGSRGAESGGGQRGVAENPSLGVEGGVT